MEPRKREDGAQRSAARRSSNLGKESVLVKVPLSFRFGGLQFFQRLAQPVVVEPVSLSLSAVPQPLA